MLRCHSVDYVLTSHGLARIGYTAPDGHTEVLKQISAPTPELAT
jgi:hypothetical protein